jgi:hypothetical protein
MQFFYNFFSLLMLINILSKHSSKTLQISKIKCQIFGIKNLIMHRYFRINFFKNINILLNKISR